MTTPSDIAVIYCRVAEEQQLDVLASQEEKCRLLADNMNVGVKAVFRDVSSGSALSRPGMAEMLSFIEAAKFDIALLIVEDFTRIARDVMLCLEVKGKLRKSGVMIATCDRKTG